MSVPTPPINVVKAVADAEKAAAFAEKAAADAEKVATGAKIAAETARNDANNAQRIAIEAQTVANAAQRAAEAAQTTANGAQHAVADAQTAASTAQDAAQKANTSASSARYSGDRWLALTVMSLLVLAVLGIAVLLGPNSSLLQDERGFWAIIAICSTVVAVNIVFYLAGVICVISGLISSHFPIKR